jgi:hypothetical protein
MTTPSCTTCAYWQQSIPLAQDQIEGPGSIIITITKGQCHRAVPPWSGANSNDWCGEWDSALPALSSTTTYVSIAVAQAIGVTQIVALRSDGETFSSTNGAAFVAGPTLPTLP